MTAVADRYEPFAPRLWRHLGALAVLAWPVMLSRAGIVTMALVDVIMLGRYGTQALGEASVALALFIPIMVTGVGLQMGLISLVARRFGAGRVDECVDTWLRALPWALVVGLIGSVVMAMGEIKLGWIGQSEALVTGGGAFSRAVAPGVLFQVLYVTCAFYLEGTGRPKPAMVVMVLANLANAGLNWVLIYGNWGSPELGAVGSALASSLVRVGLFLALFIYILRLPEVRAVGGFGRFRGLWGPGGWSAGAEMRRLGYAAGLSVLFETAALGALIQMAGMLGAVDLAAFSIANNLKTTVFMVGLGLSVAAGVRVGRAAGAKQADEVRFAGWSGLGAGVGVMALIGALLVATGRWVAMGYTGDEDVIAATVALFGIVAIVVIPQGGQIVMGQGNRALGDAYVASSLYFVAYWLVMVPAGALFAFQWEMGAAGLLWAIGLGGAVSMVLQGARFAVLAARVGRNPA